LLVTDHLPVIAGEIVSRFEATGQVRDAAISSGRRIIRGSANAIRALHRGDMTQAGILIDEARALADALVQLTLPHPAVYWAGYVQDAMKEYAEAAITAAILENRDLPAPSQLGVEDAAYLNGLAEAASELRRDTLDALRADNVERAESLLDKMDAIYDVLVTIDFPDAMTGGLRRTTDQLRAVLERTRGDLTVAVRQQRLERALHSAEAG
jgi:translin